MSIYFEDILIEEHENYLGYKLQHFISDCGGLLGLFMGCSVLSIVEIVYHLSTTLINRRKTEEDDDSRADSESNVTDIEPKLTKRKPKVTSIDLTTGPM